VCVYECAYVSVLCVIYALYMGFVNVSLSAGKYMRVHTYMELYVLLLSFA
jgi:hypothetical protein